MEVYDALHGAGASNQRLGAAAAVACHRRTIAKLEADVTVLKWMGGFNIALAVTILGLLCRFVVSA